VAYKDNLDFVERVYQKYGDIFIKENPREGKLWETILILNFSSIYFQKNLVEFYKSLGENIEEINRLEKYSKIVKGEIEDNLSIFEKDRIDIPGGWFYEVKSKFNIESFIATNISLKNPEKIIITSIKRGGDIYKISARENDMKRDMAHLLQNLTKGLRYEDAGGHIPAAGARVAQEDYEEFKRRLKSMNLQEFEIPNSK
jgi:hypothetical protein